MRSYSHAATGSRGSVARALAFFALAHLAGCAAMVETVPAQFVPAQAGEATRHILARPAFIKLSTGYDRELAAGSRWQLVGTLPQGTVYMPVDTVFSIEGRHVHEAYLVVRSGKLQGFFLPAESSYSPLVPPIPFTLGTNP